MGRRSTVCLNCLQAMSADLILQLLCGRLEGWSESCIYDLIEIEYDADVPDFNQRFSSRPGVNTTIAGFGTELCAPIPYEPFFLFFEAVGYSIGESWPLLNPAQQARNVCRLFLDSACP